MLCTCIAALKDSVTNQYFPRPYVQAGGFYQYVIIGLFANNLLTQKVECTRALPLKEKNNLENLQLPLIKERQQRHTCSLMYHDTCVCYLRTRIQHADYPRDDVGVRVLLDHQNLADLCLAHKGKRTDVYQGGIRPILSRALFYLKRVSGNGNESEFTNQAKAEELNVEVRWRDKTGKTQRDKQVS